MKIFRVVVTSKGSIRLAAVALLVIVKACRVVAHRSSTFRIAARVQAIARLVFRWMRA